MKNEMPVFAATGSCLTAIKMISKKCKNLTGKMPYLYVMRFQCHEILVYVYRKQYTETSSMKDCWSRQVADLISRYIVQISMSRH